MLENPYPESIFPEFTEHEKVKKLFKENGLSLDRYCGSFARKIWDACCKVHEEARPAIDAGEIDNLVCDTWTKVREDGGSNLPLDTNITFAIARAIADKLNGKPADHGGDDERD